MGRRAVDLPRAAAGRRSTISLFSDSGRTTPLLVLLAQAPSAPESTAVSVLTSDIAGRFPRVLVDDDVSTVYVTTTDPLSGDDSDGSVSVSTVGPSVPLTSELAEKAPITVAVSQQADDYTLALADAGTEVEGTSGSAQTVTVPPNSAVAFPVGTTINVRQMGAGQITIAAGVGVTLRAPNGAKSSKQYATVGLIQRAADEWVVSGDTTS